MQLLPYKNNYRYLVFALNTYILYILEKWKISSPKSIINSNLRTTTQNTVGED